MNKQISSNKQICRFLYKSFFLLAPPYLRKRKKLEIEVKLKQKQKTLDWSGGSHTKKIP